VLPAMIDEGRFWFGGLSQVLPAETEDNGQVLFRLRDWSRAIAARCNKVEGQVAEFQDVEEITEIVKFALRRC
jgi:hypothetical protein